MSATDGLVYGWFSDGGTIPGWPLGLGRNPLSPASVVDFRTGDSRPELVLLDGIGALEVVRIPGWQDGSGTVAWGEAYGGAARLSHQGAVLGAPTSSGTLLTGEGFYVYPNPTRGANPRLHFELGRDATGTIEIFTLSGERVRSWTGPLHMPADEWEWDVSDLASGLYLCRVRVSSGGEEKSFTHKVAVIR